MREIKFRAWDKENKVYIVPTEKNGGNVLNAWTDSESDVSIIEQFTGLHDKHGKEIYEGDRVEYLENNCVVEWNVNGHWHFKRIKDGSIYGINYWETEIIGTIHDEAAP
jgi:hypothetical protein